MQPIKDNIGQIREDAKGASSNSTLVLSTIVDKMVTQKEMEWRTARGLYRAVDKIAKYIESR